MRLETVLATMTARARIAAIRVWVIQDLTREFVACSALVALCPSFGYLICLVAIPALGNYGGLFVMVFFVLIGPFLLIIFVLHELSCVVEFVSSLRWSRAAELALLLAFGMPLLTFLWLAMAPVIALFAVRAWRRMTRSRRSATQPTDPAVLCLCAAAPWLTICALINATLVGYAAGELRPVFFQWRTEEFSWRFATEWFFGVGVPYAFAPLLLMAARRHFARD
jgi:hypothetical protein